MADEPQEEKVEETPTEEAQVNTSDGGTDEGGDSSEVDVAETPAPEPAPIVEEKVEEPTPEEPKAPVKPAPIKSGPVSKELEKIIEQIEKLSVLELADLVHALEERFGVSAQAQVAGPAAASTGSGEPTEEKTTFNVILSAAGANKISVIKAVRELVPTLGLKEAKDLVEAAPKPVLESVNKVTAEEAKQKLTAAGGTVELQ